MTFQIPLHFEDLERNTATTWKINTSSLRTQSHEQLFESINDDLQQVISSSQISHQFNVLYYLISRYSKLNLNQRKELVSLVQQLTTVIDSANANHVKIGLYFAAGISATASTLSSPCKYWEKTGLEYILETAYDIVTSIPTPFPFSYEDSDQISAILVRLTLQVLEYPTLARDKNVRPILSRCLITALSLDSNQTLPTTTALMHALNRHEHLPTPLVDIMYRMIDKGDKYKQFVSDFVREIGRLPSESLARDTTASKSVSTFISSLAEKAPEVVKTNIPLLLSHLDGESYIMRNGIVHVIGVLIQNSPQSDDPLLDILLERSYRDIHAFTRSKTMQTWSSLANARVIPNHLFPKLASIASSRLEDKTAAVRKYSAQLLGSLLTSNPFGPALRLGHFQEKLKEINAEEETDEEGEEEGENDGKENRSDDASEDDSETATDLDDDGQEKQSEENENHASAKSSPISARSQEDKEAPLSETQSVQGGDVIVEDANEEGGQVQENIQKKYYKYAVLFIQAIEKGLEIVYNLLRSKSITDVSEAVALLITAVQFQLEAASGRAVRRMLPLVLARENNIRKAVVQAYVRLLAPRGLECIEEKETAITIAKGLVSLTVGATTGEIACIEALVGSLSKRSGDTLVVSSAVVAVLWDMFAGRIPGASEEQRRSACILVGMVAPHQPESLLQRVSIIEEIGLTNSAFTRWSCVALCHLPSSFDQEGNLSLRLSNLIKNTSDLSTIDQAVTAIYCISEEPEATVEKLIRELAEGLHANASAASVQDLSRFLLVIGHVAVKQLVRTETLTNKLRKTIGNQNRDDEDNDEEEQAAAEADKALDLAEKELVSPNSLLGRYGRLARHIASDMNAPAELQASAVLCTAKLMCVQEKFCEDNLRLMFTILNSSKEPVVRSNAVTSLGDLAFRFPNLVEPWSSHIYKSLQDEDDGVRKNTLVSLTHLILNDMIKVKGQIVGLAICILDKNQRISELARLFFHELARKAANAIYNILPDTLSCMSKMEGLSREDFKQVVSFLVGLMDKERHADGMVEKLCHRFRTTESNEENHDLAYCISLLNLSERGVRKLSDQFKSYGSALTDDAVYGYIMQAVGKGKKTGASANCLQIVEELITKIESVRKAAAEEAGVDVPSEVIASDTVENVRASPMKRATRSRNKSSTQKRGGRKIVQEVSDEDTDNVSTGDDEFGTDSETDNEATNADVCSEDNSGSEEDVEIDDNKVKESSDDEEED